MTWSYLWKRLPLHDDFVLSNDVGRAAALLVNVVDAPPLRRALVRVLHEVNEPVQDHLQRALVRHCVLHGLLGCKVQGVHFNSLPAVPANLGTPKNAPTVGI